MQLLNVESKRLDGQLIFRGPASLSQSKVQYLLLNTPYGRRKPDFGEVTNNPRWREYYLLSRPPWLTHNNIIRSLYTLWVGCMCHINARNFPSTLVQMVLHIGYETVQVFRQ